MEKVLINLVLFSLVFAFMVGWQPEQLTLKRAGAMALAGLAMLGLVAILGSVFGQPLSRTFLDLRSTPDTSMGVILGVAFLYFALLTGLSVVAAWFKRRQDGKAGAA